jgi:hypothetical protein
MRDRSTRDHFWTRESLRALKQGRSTGDHFPTLA